jgi:DNA topoisomerase IA
LVIKFLPFSGRRRRQTLCGASANRRRSDGRDREREIEAFVKTEYWSIIANVTAQNFHRIRCETFQNRRPDCKNQRFRPGFKEGETHIKDEATATSIVAEAERKVLSLIR